MRIFKPSHKICGYPLSKWGKIALPGQAMPWGGHCMAKVSPATGDTLSATSFEGSSTSP